MANEANEVIMPLMGEGITEATLVKWLKAPGDQIKRDEALLEVSTDKVDTEIPSPFSGYLVKTHAMPGEVVAVNAVIAHIGESMDATIPAFSVAPKKTAAGMSEKSSGGSAAASARPSFEPQVTAGGSVRSSPLVRRIAREMNLNLGAVAGRGVAGRITKKDVLTFLDQVRQETGLAANTNGHDSGLKTTTVDGQEYLDGVKVRREKMSKMRELIAEHMVRSVRTSPHVTTTFEMDMHHMVSLREKTQDQFLKKNGFKLTFTHMIAHAAVQAIKRNPIVNVSVDGTDILHKTDINLGVAVAIESGLIVPVIKKANDMTLTQIAKATNELVARARSKKLNPDDVQGGTFSITNPGLFGSLNSQPIINQPQVAIMSVGAIIKRPVVINDDIAIRPLIQIGLTFDHRVVDGEGGAKFLADLQKIIESYDETLL